MNVQSKVYLLSVHIDSVDTSRASKGEWNVSYSLLGNVYIKTAFSKSVGGQQVMGGARKQLWLEGDRRHIENML